MKTCKHKTYNPLSSCQFITCNERGIIAQIQKKIAKFPYLWEEGSEELSGQKSQGLSGCKWNEQMFYSKAKIVSYYKHTLYYKQYKYTNFGSYSNKSQSFTCVWRNSADGNHVTWSHLLPLSICTVHSIHHWLCSTP